MSCKKQKLQRKQSGRLILTFLWLPLVAWSGCAQPDLSGRLESEPAEVERLRERLGKIDW